jgi:HEAT repeat protein
LARSLDGNGLSRTYHKAYRRFGHKLPSSILSGLPKPTDPTTTRMKALSLLIRLRPESKLAEPSIARAMSDDHPFVRQLAVGWYETGLPNMNAEERKARLPDFLRLAQDNNHWVRNNAATALAFYREEAQTVAPVLVKVLPEPDPRIQITIAKALVHVAPSAAVRAGVVPIVIQILKNPDGQVAYGAAELLGELQAEPALSVPALLEGLEASEREVAIASFRALTKFKEQADAIVPALKKASQRKDIPSWVKSELAQIDPSAGKTGTK